MEPEARSHVAHSYVVWLLRLAAGRDSASLQPLNPGMPDAVDLFCYRGEALRPAIVPETDLGLKRRLTRQIATAVDFSAACL